jgi:hypothetical protein
MKNKVIITQSNYIPWKGFFTTMKKATHLVLYDDMQYTRRDWRNRNKIVTSLGSRWISIPIVNKGLYHQKINEAVVSENNWNVNHWSIIKQNYSKAPYFNQYGQIFSEIYNSELKNVHFLSRINRILLERCIKMLGIEIKILDSRQFRLHGDKTEKLVNICKDLDADEYFTGPAAKDYIEEDLFNNEDISVSYYDLAGFPEYKQLWDSFDHYVSIIDMFMNLGDNTVKNFNWRDE